MGSRRRPRTTRGAAEGTTTSWRVNESPPHPHVKNEYAGKRPIAVKNAQGYARGPACKAKPRVYGKNPQPEVTAPDRADLPSRTQNCGFNATIKEHVSTVSANLESGFFVRISTRRKYGAAEYLQSNASAMNKPESTELLFPPFRYR